MAVRLVDIPEIAQSLKTANTKAISLLNSIVFEIPHDRTTRSRLREFTGFTETDLTQKIKKIKESFTLADLIQVANILHIEICTDRDKLCDSIFAALLKLNELKQQIAESTINSENEENTEVTPNPDQFLSPHSYHHSFGVGLSIKEISDEIKNFDGSSNYPISSFIDAVSNVSTLYNLSNIQTLAVAKRCITGTAKIFFNSLPHITSWEIFQNYFIEEFEEKFTAADIHKTLSQRYLHKGESCTEYLIKMREIANKAEIDEKSICQYVIQGLPNSPNKLLLYGCTNFKELKQKLLLFENLQKEQFGLPQHHRKFTPTENFRHNRSFGPPKTDFGRNTAAQENNFSVHSDINNGTTAIKCFQCGDINHMASDCSFKQIRCFYCKNFGHKISNCPKKFPQPEKTANVHQITDKSTPLLQMTLTITLSNYCVSAVVDSGSPYTLIRESLHKEIGSPALQNTSLTLTGLGAAVIHPIGSFHMPFKIKNSTFTTEFFVIPDHLLTVDIIIGYDVLQQGDFRFNRSGVQLIEAEISPTHSSVHFCGLVLPHITTTQSMSTLLNLDHDSAPYSNLKGNLLKAEVQSDFEKKVSQEISNINSYVQDDRQIAITDASKNIEKDCNSSEKDLSLVNEPLLEKLSCLNPDPLPDNTLKVISFKGMDKIQIESEECSLKFHSEVNDSSVSTNFSNPPLLENCETNVKSNVEPILVTDSENLSIHSCEISPNSKINSNDSKCPFGATSNNDNSLKLLIPDNKAPNTKIASDHLQKVSEFHFFESEVCDKNNSEVPNNNNQFEQNQNLSVLKHDASAKKLICLEDVPQNSKNSISNTSYSVLESLSHVFPEEHNSIVHSCGDYDKLEFKKSNSSTVLQSTHDIVTFGNISDTLPAFRKQMCYPGAPSSSRPVASTPSSVNSEKRNFKRHRLKLSSIT